MSRSRSYLVRLRPWLALTAAAFAAAGSVLFGAAPAAAEDSVGYVRLAHLSPDTGKVDVYLSKSGDPSFKEQIFRHVGYGVMSNYVALPVGAYAIAMRSDGDPASTAPVISGQLVVNAGSAYTVAGTGRHAVLGLTVLQDDLSRPTGGKAKVRVIQASVNAPVLDVSMVNGTPIASGVQFATTTPYEIVNPGTWTLKLQPSGKPNVSTLGANLAAGSVYSLLVLDGTNGLKLELRTDARGGATAPDGGVETGAGGAENIIETAPSSNSALSMIGIGTALLAGLVVIAVRLRRVASRRS